jgi:hypothetical protein
MTSKEHYAKYGAREREKRRQLIAEHCCTNCGASIDIDDNHRKCAECREQQKIKRHRKKCGSSELDRLAIISRERGVSYGILVAQLERGLKNG